MTVKNNEGAHGHEKEVSDFTRGVAILEAHYDTRKEDAKQELYRRKKNDNGYTYEYHANEVIQDDEDRPLKLSSRNAIYVAIGTTLLGTGLAYLVCRLENVLGLDAKFIVSVGFFAGVWFLFRGTLPGK